MRTEERPDPDALLHAVQATDARQGRARLKVFLGMAAGVGKTHAMLSEAQELRSRGVDVVVGLAETHGRAETQALLQGLECIPLRRAPVGDTTVDEFDLDAALARKPEILLLDELAHTNAPGSRHTKRWQDVEELLHDGVSVYTCLNVQHIESLNDVVAQITGVVVRETVPDAVLQRADQVELIDLPPDELLQRLREGKVYVPALAERALASFFRPGNLTALRDLALRQTAQRVEADMEVYRSSRSIADVWPAAPRILACVANNGLADLVVRTACRIAGSMHAECAAVHVRPSESPEVGALRTQADAALDMAETLGIQTSVLAGPDVVPELLRYARTHNISLLVVGRESRRSRLPSFGPSVVSELSRRATDMDVYVVTGPDDASRRKRARWLPAERGRPAGWLTAASALVCATAAGLALFSRLNPTDVAMLYLAAIAVVAARAGTAESIMSAVVAMLAFNFFFVQPRLTFAVYDPSYILTFAIMLAVSILVSTLSTRFRQSLSEANERQRRTAELYALSRELTRAQRKTEIADAVRRRLGDALHAEVGMYLTIDDRKRQLGSAPCAMLELPEERAVAEWAADHGQTAGKGTETLPGSKGLYLPLLLAGKCIGVLAVYAPDTLSTPLRELATAYADQAVLALERTVLAKQAHSAHLAAEQEKLRNALLSSVSHDLRTPLTAVVGAAETMLKQPALGNDARDELAQTIYDEATRLSRLVSNLLQMTRIDAGHVTLKGDWVHLEELVAGAVERAGGALVGHDVTTHVEPLLPLLYVDAVLMEQVLVNLLENAARYSPAGAPIEIRAFPSGGFSRIEVRDQGPGFPAGREDEMFAKYTRGPGASPGEGFGLGLAICRAIVEAHHGRIWARNRPEGGATVIMEFALTELPPAPEGDDA